MSCEGYRKDESDEELAQRSLAAKKENAVDKAWAHLATLVGKRKCASLRNGNFVTITGSLGGKYIIYPNGHVVRLDKREPIQGKLLKSYTMPYPDVLSTMCAWIMYDEARFLENWGCGNISAVEENAHSCAEAYAVHVASLIEVQHRRSRWRENWPVFALLIIAGFVVAPIILGPTTLLTPAAGEPFAALATLAAVPLLTLIMLASIILVFTNIGRA